MKSPKKRKAKPSKTKKPKARRGKTKKQNLELGSIEVVPLDFEIADFAFAYGAD